MKYFSVDFLPDKKDVNKKAIFFNLLFGTPKEKLFPQLIMICLFTVFFFFVKQYELIFYSLIALVAVPKIIEIIIIFSHLKKEDTPLSKRPVTVDFYSDHFVYRYVSTQQYKGNFEKHYPFSKVTNVIESKNAITFAFGETDTVLIPKRAISTENREMINNLIINLFKSKFVKIEF